MSVKLDMSPELEARIDKVIQAVRKKQQEGKIELYNDEMKEMLDTYGEFDLLCTGCRIVKSSWKGYIILPEEFIEEKFIPSLKTKMALIISKNEDK